MTGVQTCALPIPGQQALKRAKVLVIGAGGLGAPSLMYLGAAGVGTLGVIDDDEVSLSNLQRQIIHGTPDIGVPKVESAKAALARINPHVNMVAHRERLTAANARSKLALATYSREPSGATSTAIGKKKRGAVPSRPGAGSPRSELTQPRPATERATRNGTMTDFTRTPAEVRRSRAAGRARQEGVRFGKKPDDPVTCARPAPIATTTGLGMPVTFSCRRPSPRGESRCPPAS